MFFIMIIGHILGYSCYMCSSLICSSKFDKCLCEYRSHSLSNSYKSCLCGINGSFCRYCKIRFFDNSLMVYLWRKSIWIPGREEVIIYYRVIRIAATYVGQCWIYHVLNIADNMNALMATFNLIAFLSLSKLLIKKQINF